ncbi:MAG: AMP-binding protein, partial [Halioglobus sp.]
MQATMMHMPMTVQMILLHGAAVFPASRVGVFDGSTVSHTPYALIAENAARLAAALHSLGVAKGDRIGTFSWNNLAHMEAYLAIPSMGAIMHTINIRLSAEQIAYIINHAGDKVVIVDSSLRDVFAPVVPLLETVRHVLMVGAADSLAGVHCIDYAELTSQQEPFFDWPLLDETSAAAICYTSGTT